MYEVCKPVEIITSIINIRFRLTDETEGNSLIKVDNKGTSCIKI